MRGGGKGHRAHARVAGRGMLLTRRFAGRGIVIIVRHLLGWWLVVGGWREGASCLLCDIM